MDNEHRDVLRAAVAALEQTGAEYFLFGANAQNVWGEPRFTKDGDFIVFLADERFEDLFTALTAAGFTVERDRHRDRLRSGRMVKLYRGLIPVDFVLGETEFDRSAGSRRRRVEYLEISLWVASPEDLILYKLIAHRAHDLGDIERVIRRRRDTLDRAYLRKWARWLARETGMTRIETTLKKSLAEFGKRRV